MSTIRIHCHLSVWLLSAPTNRSLRPTSAAVKTTVHAFITCRLDWCNSPLYGVPENLLRKVHSVQNAAARLLTSTGRLDHITLVLRQLHWLLIQRRVEFEIACLVHQSLASKAPSYLICDIRLVSKGRRSLHSSSNRTHSLLYGHVAVFATKALLLRDRACGTADRHIPHTSLA